MKSVELIPYRSQDLASTMHKLVQALRSLRRLSVSDRVRSIQGIVVETSSNSYSMNIESKIIAPIRYAKTPQAASHHNHTAQADYQTHLQRQAGNLASHQLR